MSTVLVHSVCDFRFHTLKISAYFLKNKTTAFMVQRAQVKYTRWNRELALPWCISHKQAASSEVTTAWNNSFYLFFYKFIEKKKKKKDNNWKSVFGPNIFPRATPPGWKAKRSEQSPLCCLFQDHLCVASDVQICSRATASSHLSKFRFALTQRGQSESFFLCARREQKIREITNSCMLHSCHCRHWGSTINPASWIWNAMYNFIIEWRWNQPPA